MSGDTTRLSLAQLDLMRTGARTAMRTCMGVTAGDRVYILTDATTRSIGRLLSEEAADCGSAVLLHELENFTERPVRTVPDGLRRAVMGFRPTVTFYAASAQPGEVTFRTGLRTFLLDELQVRHAHMPGVTPQLMQEGMRTDYRTIAAVTTAVYDIARVAETIRVSTADGTALTAHFTPALRWVACTGIYHRAKQWGNLPEGETYTCPANLEGQFVVHVVGDHFSARYGVLKQPVTLDIHESRVTTVHGANEQLVRELNDYLHTAENADRAGEFAIGTNIGLNRLMGNLLQDEKLPGIHVAFGNPYPAETGATWTAPVHVDMIPVGCTIEVDGEAIMRNGHYDYDVLGIAEPRGF